MTEMENPNMAPEKILDKGVWPGSRNPVNFWALNGNSYITDKDTNFNFAQKYV